MSTDRELLELAAKAAGMKLTWGDKYQVGGDLVDCSDIPYVLTGEPDQAPWYWNPLEDDGDEARLEASLELDVEWGDSSVVVSRHGIGAGEPYGSDKQAARRRAGVRAAAEIGRAMP